MTLLSGAALFLAALLAGALNSVAGGGSFISFPTLVLTGVPSIPANATNTVALLPGSIASIPPYRKDFANERRELLLFSAVSVVGGVLGAVILLRTPQKLFDYLIPWLLLLATLVFAFGGNAATWLRARRATDGAEADEGVTGASSWRAFAVVMVVQFVIALYGGFFGGGIGIMMLAGLSLLGMRNIHAMNALKVVLASVINGVAVVAFIIAGKVFWPQALLMIVGAIAGGYAGAALAHRVPPIYVRRFVIAVGLLISAYFFYNRYVHNRLV